MTRILLRRTSRSTLTRWIETADLEAEGGERGDGGGSGEEEEGAAVEMASARIALRALLKVCQTKERELAADLNALVGEQCCPNRVSRCANCHRLSREVGRALDEWCFYCSLCFSLEHATQLLGDSGGTPYDILEETPYDTQFLGD